MSNFAGIHHPVAYVARRWSVRRGRGAMSALGRLALWCLRLGRTPEEIVKRFRESLVVV